MNAPSLDKWLTEAKEQENSKENGMYLFHNGVVRSTSKAYARGITDKKENISSMVVSYDSTILELYKKKTLSMTGINYIRVWINQGCLNVGDTIMLVLVGGDTRPNVIKALEFFVDKIKSECITEQEILK